MRNGTLLSLLCYTLCLVATAVAIPVHSHAANTPSKRAKVIDFDDDIVEGLNKRPLDSLSEIAEANKRKHKPHLYRKRVGFRSETAESLRALRYTP